MIRIRVTGPNGPEFQVDELSGFTWRHERVSTTAFHTAVQP
jgi:hypothetical protein